MATTRDRKNKEESSTSSKELSLLDVLSAKLSREEVRQALAACLLVMDGAALERLAARLQPETMAILRQLLSPSAKSPAVNELRPSIDKIREEWDSAWEEWNSCVAETGDEEGKYVLQEHHWEPPYLDTSSFAEDLEPIAARMRALLPPVLKQNLDPGFSFEDSLRSTAEEVGAGLPEWMEDTGEGIVFGPEVTRFLLEWEWGIAMRDKLGGFGFTDKMCLFEESCNVGLDDDVINDFILTLEAESQKDILQGIIDNGQSGHWAQALKPVHGAWCSLYRELCHRWDPSRYLEACRSGSAQNWKLALPLIEDLLARKAFQDGLTLVDQTVRYMLHTGDGAGLDSKKELLVSRGSLLSQGEKSHEVISLLTHWLKLAQALKDEEAACALRFQLLTLRRWREGDAVLEAIRRFPSPRFDSMREQLYEEWKKLIDRASLESFSGSKEKRQPTWVHSLVDAARAGANGTVVLKNAVFRWMDEMGKTQESLQRELPSLEVLTLDLDLDSRLCTISTVLKRILDRREQGDRRLTETRRAWLRRLGASEVFPRVMQFWKQNAYRLVPDPEKGCGNYTDCAEWLAVVRDLDQPSCNRILQEWKLKHRRRKNLWKALESLKVSIPLR
jgi:hypothetical protein